MAGRWASSETSAWQKGGSAAHADGGSDEHLPSASGRWSAQRDYRVLAFSCQPESDGGGAARRLGGRAEVSDRESDFYEKWGQLPEPGFHILTRANVDRSIVATAGKGSGKLSTAPLQPAGTATIELRARPGRPARSAKLVTRFARVALKRPGHLSKYKGSVKTVQARDGKSAQPASIAFLPAEIETLPALLPEVEGKTALQKNPHPAESFAWAGWIIAKLGGWDGYPKSKPQGPITFRHGLEYFKSIARGWKLKNV